MKKIGAKREIPNDIAFPARTGHDACEPFGSRAAIGSEPFGSRPNGVRAAGVDRSRGAASTPTGNSRSYRR